MHESGDVEPSAHVAAVNAAHLLPVEIDLGLPVDAVEVEPEMLPRVRCGGRNKFVAIPEVGAEEGVGDCVLVVTEVGVGDGAVVQVAGEDRPRHGGDHPVLVCEACGGNLLAIRGHERGALQTPFARCEFHRAVRMCSDRGLRNRNGAAAPEDLEFAEDVAAVCFSWLGHQDANVAATRRLRQTNIVIGSIANGQRLNRSPLRVVIRDLDRSLGGAPNPSQRDTVESAHRAQVHGDPFFATARAHPRTGEVLGTGDAHLLPFVEEHHLRDSPGADAGCGELDAVGVEAHRRSKRNGLEKAWAGVAHWRERGPCGAPHFFPVHTII